MNRAIFVSAVFTSLVAGVAGAQPINDTCANAIPILSQPSGFDRAYSLSVNLIDAGVAPEAPIACVANSNSTVWFTFTPAITARYEITGCSATNPGASAVDTVLAIYDGTCGALNELVNGCNDDFCGSQSRLALTLNAGTTYYLQTGRFSTTLPGANDAVQLSVQFPSGADSCTNVPDLPLAVSVPVAITPFSDAGVSELLNDSEVGGVAACYTGLGHASLTTPISQAPGRDVVHRFTATKTALYSFRVGASPRAFDTAIYVTDSCATPTTPPFIYAPPQCLAAANRQGTTATSVQEEVTCLPLNLGQVVYVWVDEGAAQASPYAGASFPLEVTECVRESEPNNDPTDAGTLNCGITGSIADGGDVDFYALGTPAVAGTRVFAMAEAGASGVNRGTSFDLQMRVTNATLTLEYDADDLVDPYGSSSSGVAGTPLPTGVPAYLRINHTTATSIAEPYRIYSVLQTGTPVNEVEPNDLPAQALGAQSNYFAGTLPASTDVDFYAFQAPAGAMIYLSLDQAPLRTGSTATGNHTLALWDSAGQLFLANDSATTVNNTAGTTLTSTAPTVPSEHVLFRAPKSGVYFARVGRTGTNTNPNEYILSISLDCSAGGGFVAASLTSLTPGAGSTAGNEPVTLTGTGFGPGTVVTFGGVAATVEAVSATSMIVRTPLGVDGPVDVTVRNFGHPPSTIVGGFVYSTPVVPPTVTSVTPAEGPVAGGQTVTVRGTFYKPGAEVLFDVGGTNALGTNVVIVTLNELRVTTPALIDGFATVTVRNPIDALEGSLPNAYRFNDAPVIASIAPPTGLTTGGTVVTITGTGFRPGASVRFGSLAGSSISVDPSGTSITVTAPSASLNGPVDVTVTNVDAQTVTRVDGFRYVFPPPTLTAVAPASGPSSGGTAITLTGTNFVAGPVVLVGGNPATGVVRVSATQIAAVVPAGAPGAADVLVSNSDGQNVTLAGAFTYIAPPRVTGVVPARGSAIGGTAITVSGADFRPGLALRIGGAPVFAVSVVNATTATGISPAGPPGLVDVEAINSDGQRGVLTGGFTFDGAPSLVSLNPSVGSTAGGTVVTLRGAGFVAGAVVRFGSELATNVTVVSATEVTATAPAAPMSVVSVTVTNPDGQATTLMSAFRYVLAPTIASLTPVTGDARGGTVTRITGTGFGAGTTVTFGGIASPLVTLVSSTAIDAVTPAHAPGVVDVSVANPDGAQGTLSMAFTFTRAAPVVTAIAPASGTTLGGSVVSITGVGFTSSVTVTFGGAAATDVVSMDGLLRVRTPAHAAGAVDVVVTNDDAQSVTAAGAFTFVAPANGEQGVVMDGGHGSLGEAPDAGPGTMTPTGCGCSSVDVFGLFAAIGLLLRRRRAR